MTKIESILSFQGPLMSSHLARLLAENDSIPINTASQKISRNTNIEKIKGFYSSNQSFCYLKEHENKDIFYERFIKSLYENGRKYWYCINALRLHGGILHQNFLECYTNYPIMALKGHLPFNKVMQKFVQAGVLVYNESYYSLSPKFQLNRITSVAHKTIELIKKDILTSFNSLVKNTGIISFNTGAQFEEYGKFRWAFKGVSNIVGLIQNGNPGFLLADILIGNAFYKDDVRFFIEKVQHIQSYKNAPRILPIFIVDDLDRDALSLLKQKGIIIGFIGELFGQKYAETLKELVTILNNAGACLKKTPEKYLDLINELKKYNEGLLNNIRGTLFEFMVGHIYSTDCQSVDIGREIIENNSRHEMDILAVFSDRVIIAECKAKKASVDIETINKWIEVKVRAFKIWFDKQEIFAKKKLEFQIWSTSGFTDDALERLKRFSESAQRFKVLYFKQNEIREKAISMNNKKLKEALDNFFLRIDV